LGGDVSLVKKEDKGTKKTLAVNCVKNKRLVR